MTRTYDKLQSWHYEEIKRSGWKVGDTVYFYDRFDGLVKAVIEKFKIHWTGEDIIMVDVIWDEEYKWKDPENVWSADGNNINSRIDKRHATVYFNDIQRTPETAKDNQIATYKAKISDLESRIKYYKKEIDKLNEVK